MATTRDPTLPATGSPRPTTTPGEPREEEPIPMLYKRQRPRGRAPAAEPGGGDTKSLTRDSRIGSGEGRAGLSQHGGFGADAPRGESHGLLIPCRVLPGDVRLPGGSRIFVSGQRDTARPRWWLHKDGQDWKETNPQQANNSVRDGDPGRSPALRSTPEPVIRSITACLRPLCPYCPKRGSPHCP